MGKLIVIEGLDGSGKATQARLLAKRLSTEGKNVLQVTFPDYESLSSGPVRMYLSGELGTNPNDINPFAASAFYAVDRFASFKKNWQAFYDDGGIVIADRYTTSNAVHQCSKLEKSKWDSYIEWLFDFEYKKVMVPTPAQVIYLDMSPEVSQKLMTSRYNGDETKKDIHEKDINHLQNSRKAALYCLEKLGWAKIQCDDGSTAFSIEDISEKIYTIAKKALD